MRLRPQAEIVLTIRSGGVHDHQARCGAVHSWHKALLHEAVAGRSSKSGEEARREGLDAYFVQRMKTKWGGSQSSMSVHYPAQHRTHEETEGTSWST